jgi:hypothetical protein
MSPEAAIQQLGGGTQIKYQYYTLSNGRKVLIVNSKYHASSRYYWYGISPGAMNGCEEHSVSHVAFGMGTKAIAVVPIERVIEFINATHVSKKADKSIKHYHVLISDGSEPEMYWSEAKPKVHLKEYLVLCKELVEGVAGS